MTDIKTSDEPIQVYMPRNVPEVEAAAQAIIDRAEVNNIDLGSTPGKILVTAVMLAGTALDAAQKYRTVALNKFERENGL